MQSKQSLMPICGFSAFVLLTLCVVPRVLTPEGGSGTALARATVSPMESTFLEFDRVTDLLNNGKTREAKLLLEELGGQTLVIEGYSGGQGALRSFAPT